MKLGRPFSAALFAVSLAVGQLLAQGPTGTVTGRIVDASTRDPLAGVSVAVGDRGSITDEAGRFMITAVPAGAPLLRVTQIGYAEATRPITVSAGQTTFLDLTLDPEAIQLSELVVVGYGQQSARDIASSIEKVGTEEFNTGRVISPEQLIQGKVAGVDVIDSGEPGGGISLRIRGGTSIDSSNEPLFIVDGMPIAIGGGISAGRNPFNFINPDDIVSVTVLKDASAAAIYGTGGANGVVLIETKGGSGVGAPGSQLSYTGSMSSSSVSNEPAMLSATQFRQAVLDFAPAGTDTLLGNMNTDWRDAVQQTGMGQEHTVAFSGASGDLAYRLSVGYLGQEGVLQGTTVERATVGLNYGQGFFDNDLRITANIKGAHEDDQFTPGAVIGNATIFAPTQPIFDPNSPNGGYFEWYHDINAVENPVAWLDLVTDEGTTYRSLGDIEANYRLPFLAPLNATVRLGYDVAKTEREIFRPTILRSEFESATPGFVSRANNTQRNILLDAFLNYGHRFAGSGLGVDVTGGYAWAEGNAEFPYFEADSLSFDYLGTSGVPAAGFQSSSIFVDRSRLISFFGRTNLSLRDRYLLTLSLRRDGSSKFGPDEQWGLFPAAAFAWRLSSEPFMQDVRLFDDLKLRASWGVAGNQAIPNYLQFAIYQISDAQGQYPFGDEYITTIRPRGYDEGIKWEETTSWNLGVDFGISDSRFTGSLDYYVKQTDDLLFRVQVPAGTNLSDFVTTNIGSVENRGFEISLDATVFSGQDGGFSWIAGFNAATNDNEITRLIRPGGGEIFPVGGISGGVGNTIQVLQTGQPVNAFYVLRTRPDNPDFGDIDNDGDIDDLDYYIDQPTVLCDPGDPDSGLCPDGQIDADDRVPYESPAPKWIFGHTSRLGWRSFDLSFTLRAHLGNYVYNNVASNSGHYRALSYVGAPNNLHTSVLRTGFTREQYFADIYVEEASFLRMDNITLGYTLPPLAGRQVRVFGTLQNVFTMTDYTGVDPLTNVNGIDNNLYPRSRTFTAGATVQF